MDNTTMSDEAVKARLVQLPLLERVRLRKMFNIGPVGKAICIEKLLEVDRSQLMIDLTICDLIREHNIEVSKEILTSFWNLFKTFAPSLIGNKVPGLDDIIKRVDDLVALDNVEAHDDDMDA